MGGAHCLSVDEAERIVENMTEFDLQDVGNKQWLEQHGQIEKLNQQAHASARDKSDEFVLEAFLTFDKLGTADLRFDTHRDVAGTSLSAARRTLGGGRRK